MGPTLPKMTEISRWLQGCWHVKPPGKDLKKSIVKHDKHTFSPVESSDGKAGSKVGCQTRFRYRFAMICRFASSVQISFAIGRMIPNDFYLIHISVYVYIVIYTYDLHIYMYIYIYIHYFSGGVKSSVRYLKTLPSFVVFFFLARVIPDDGHFAIWYLIAH